MFIQPGICVSACPAISSPRFIGSFTTKRQINEVTFLLQLPARYRIHRVHSTCHSSSPSVQGTEEPAAPPPPEVQAEPSIYWVQGILDSHRRAGHLEYLIDWECYGLEERSWVARDDVLDPSILAELHPNHPDQPAPKGRGRPRRHSRASGATPGGGGTVRESVSPVTTNDTHQITITWLLSTATCHHSSRALYQHTSPKHSLSDLKHSMCYLPDSPTFVYLLVVPVSRSLCSCSCVPPSPRSYSHWIHWKRKQDLLCSGKTLLNIAIPCTLTWTLHLASLHCHYSINLLLFALTSMSLVYLRTNWDLL